ncbi:MAG: prepilin-type N-terminal cleavage/methylation domain-containing protein, partial [Actinobacteria bacterium]
MAGGKQPVRSKRSDLLASLAGNQRRQAGVRGQRSVKNIFGLRLSSFLSLLKKLSLYVVAKSVCLLLPNAVGISGQDKIEHNQSNNEQRTTNNGFSLTEVLVAAAILGLSMLAIYSIYIKTYSASGRQELKANASSLAQEKMEKIINKPYAYIALWASPSPPTNYTFTNKDSTQVQENIIIVNSGTQSEYVEYIETVNKIGKSFTITTLISWHDDDNDGLASDDPNPNDYKRVHIEVDWAGNNNPIILDRFVSMYYRPHATSNSAADAGEIRLDDNTNYASLGSSNIAIYSGGNKTSKAEAWGISTENYNEESQTAWEEVFTDDDSSADYPDELHQTDSLASLSDDPIYLSGSSSAEVSAKATGNTIGSQTWHPGEFTTIDGWPD